MSYDVIEERGTSRPLPLRDAWGHRRSSSWWGEPGPQEDPARFADEVNGTRRPA